MRFPLKRFYRDARQTLGTLAIGPMIIFTIELPWVNNRPHTSCFPAGSYKMEIIEIDGKEKVRLELIGHSEPLERTLLNIEVSNWARQLEGCVGVGMGVKRDTGSLEAVDETRPTYMVTNSVDALQLLITEMKLWPDVPMFLEVEDCF